VKLIVRLLVFVNERIEPVIVFNHLINLISHTRKIKVQCKHRFFYLFYFCTSFGMCIRDYRGNFIAAASTDWKRPCLDTTEGETLVSSLWLE